MHTVPFNTPCGFDQRYVVENKDRPLRLDRPHGGFYDEWDRFLANNGQRKPSRETYRREYAGYETALAVPTSGHWKSAIIRTSSSATWHAGFSSNGSLPARSFWCSASRAPTRPTIRPGAVTDLYQERRHSHCPG